MFDTDEQIIYAVKTIFPSLSNRHRISSFAPSSVIQKTFGNFFIYITNSTVNNLYYKIGLINPVNNEHTFFSIEDDVINIYGFDIFVPYDNNNFTFAIKYNNLTIRFDLYTSLLSETPAQSYSIESIEKMSLSQNIALNDGTFIWCYLRRYTISYTTAYYNNNQVYSNFIHKEYIEISSFSFLFFQTGYFNLYRFGNDKAIISTVNLKNYIIIQIIDKKVRCLRDTIVYHNTITDYYYKYDITIMDNSYTFLLIRYGLMPIIFTLALMVVRFQMTIKI